LVHQFLITREHRAILDALVVVLQSGLKPS
jgi:hypothetical protein